MKKKKPIFTYIITILNSFMTASIVGFLGCMLVMGTTSEGKALSFKGLFFPSIIFGYVFCLIVSLLYFYMIRKGKMRARWWINILMIVLSYSSIPAHAFISAKTLGMNPENYNDSTPLFSLSFPALILTIIGFATIGIITRKSQPEP
jgi:hypothetical protein